MDNEPELLPCPFCPPSVWKNLGIETLDPDNECYVYCGCGARGPSKLTKAEAIAAWNRRSNK